MYAIVQIAGRQYQVAPEQEMEVDYLDVAPGGTLTVKDVMLLADQDDIAIGTPFVPCRVDLEVLKNDHRPKVTSVIFKKRGGMRRKTGHRQKFSVVRVKSIVKGEG